MNALFNKLWRIFATGFCFILFGIGALSIGILFQVISLLPLPNKQFWARNTIHYSCRIFILLMQKLGLLDYNIDFTIQKLQSSNLIIANHPTLLDAILIFAHFKNICCITKAKLWKNPFTACVVRAAGFIANDNASFIDIAVAKLRTGENLLIFPEGTRTSNENKLVFKRGAANIAVQSNCQILPILITCNPSTLKKGQVWYDIPKFKPVFKLKSLPFITLSDCLDISRPRTLQYRDLTNYLKSFYESHLQLSN